MQLFEYKVVNVEHGKKNEEEALNKLGQDGWELVAVVLTNSGRCVGKEKQSDHRRLPVVIVRGLSFMAENWLRRIILVIRRVWIVFARILFGMAYRLWGA